MVLPYIPKILRRLSSFEASLSSERIGWEMQAALNAVWCQMKDAALRYGTDNNCYYAREPRLVAVSKTKPVELIEEAYTCGQKSFGENYVQELVQKAKKIKEKGECEDIKWHFIGHLQRNKVNNLCSAPNLEMVETVDSVKLAEALNRSWGNLKNQRKLKIMVQVNTSEEKNKNGCADVKSCLDLVVHVKRYCENLEFVGLMTIGRVLTQPNDEPNPDFESLVSYRAEICNKLGILPNTVELSMGMSADYVQAILAGSTNVRVGSVIFGKRAT